MRTRPASVDTASVSFVSPPPWWVAALALAGGLLVQSSLAPLFAFRGGVVSVVELVTLWFALRTGPSGALAFGAFAGAGEDALGTSGAAWTLATAAVAWTISRARGGVPVDRPALFAIAIAGATLARASLALLTMTLEGRPLPGLATHLHAAIWQSGLTAVAGTVAFALFPRLGGARGRY